MPKVGIEPTYPRVHDFESCASAYSATSAGEKKYTQSLAVGQAVEQLNEACTR